MGPREAGPGHWERVGKGARLASMAHLQWHGVIQAFREDLGAGIQAWSWAPVESRAWLRGGDTRWKGLKGALRTECFWDYLTPLS